MTFSNAFCLKSIYTQIPPNFVPEDPIDNRSALVQVMAWHQTGAKPLPEPMMTQFTDVYMHPQALVNEWGTCSLYCCKAVPSSQWVFLLTVKSVVCFAPLISVEIWSNQHSWNPVAIFLFSWWCHDMEMLSALLFLCEANSSVTGG